MTIITCKKVFKNGNDYTTCNNQKLLFYSFKTTNDVLIELKCPSNHSSFFQLSELRDDEDVSKMHDILANSKSKYAICNLTKGNNCQSDEEKNICLEESFNQYKNR